MNSRNKKAISMFNIFKNLFGNKDAELRQAIDNGAVIIDVRTRTEFDQGHIAGSRNIPLNEIRLKADTIRKWGKPVITVCRSGSRSAAAKNILTDINIASYNGGGWLQFKNKFLS